MYKGASEKQQALTRTGSASLLPSGRGAGGGQQLEPLPPDYKKKHFHALGRALLEILDPRDPMRQRIEARANALLAEWERQWEAKQDAPTPSPYDTPERRKLQEDWTAIEAAQQRVNREIHLHKLRRERVPEALFAERQKLSRRRVWVESGLRRTGRQKSASAKASKSAQRSVARRNEKTRAFAKIGDATTLVYEGKVNDDE